MSGLIVPPCSLPAAGRWWPHAPPYRPACLACHGQQPCLSASFTARLSRGHARHVLRRPPDKRPDGQKSDPAGTLSTSPRGRHDACRGGSQPTEPQHSTGFSSGVASAATTMGAAVMAGTGEACRGIHRHASGYQEAPGQCSRRSRFTGRRRRPGRLPACSASAWPQSSGRPHPAPA